MPLFRATFFFKNDRGYGWTETIHSLKPTLTDVLNSAATLGALRLQLLGSDVQMPFIRVSDDLVRRDSMIFPVPGQNQVRRGGGVVPSDIPNTCLIVRMDATALRRRTLYLRGQADDIVQNGGQYVPDGNFIGAFNNWVSALENDSWGIKGKSNLALAVPIINATQTLPSGKVNVTTGTPHGLSVRDNVTIRNVSGAIQLNGAWQVTSIIDATTFAVTLTQILSPYLGGGTATAALFDILPIMDAIVRGASHRITGRPFDSPRGRRRRRA